MSLTAIRLTDAANTRSEDTGQPLASCQIEYPTASPFSADNRYILILEVSYFALYDVASRTRIKPLIFADASCEPRWSRFDPNVFYYHRGNALWRYDVAIAGATKLHTFEEYTSIGAKGESEIGEGSDSLVLAGDGRDIFTFQINTLTKGPARAEGWLDAIGLTPDGNVVLARNDGLFLYDASMNLLRQLTRANGHRHTARDTNGKAWLVWDNSNEPNPRAFAEHAIVAVDLETAEQRKLLDLGWEWATHATAPMGPLGWAIVGSYDNAQGGELIRVWLDGRPAEPLLRHGSNSSTYEGQPRPSVSRDGRWLSYNSNVGGRTDVYLVDLGWGLQPDVIITPQPPETNPESLGPIGPIPQPDGTELTYWPQTTPVPIKTKRKGLWARLLDLFR